MPKGPQGFAEDRSGFVDSDTQTLTVETELKVVGLTVLYHPKIERVGEHTVLTGLGSGGSTPLARQEPLFAQPGSALGRPLGTKRLSRSPVLLAPDPAGLRFDPAGSRTAVEIDGRPLLGPTVVPHSVLREGAVLLLGHWIVLLAHPMEPRAYVKLPDYGLVGESPAVLKMRQDIDRVAELAIPVLLQGEQGTGKARVARALHEAGSRRPGEFVRVDFSRPTTEEELVGLFHRAREGTLFLERLDEAPRATQEALARRLHEIDADSTDGSSPRIVSGAESNLELAASLDQLDASLYQAVAGFVMSLMPLRKRREDFGRLLAHFLARELSRSGEPERLKATDPTWMPPALWARLATAPWPGNLEQLKTFAERLVRDNLGREQVSELAALDGVNLDGVGPGAGQGSP